MVYAVRYAKALETGEYPGPNNGQPLDLEYGNYSDVWNYLPAGKGDATYEELGE